MREGGCNQLRSSYLFFIKRLRKDNPKLPNYKIWSDKDSNREWVRSVIMNGPGFITPPDNRIVREETNPKSIQEFLLSKAVYFL